MVDGPYCPFYSIVPPSYHSPLFSVKDDDDDDDDKVVIVIIISIILPALVTFFASRTVLSIASAHRILVTATSRLTIAGHPSV